MSISRNDITAILSTEGLSDKDKTSRILDLHTADVKSEVEATTKKHEAEKSSLEVKVEVAEKNLATEKETYATLKSEYEDFKKSEGAKADKAKVAQDLQEALQKANITDPKALKMLMNQRDVDSLTVKNGKVEGLEDYVKKTVEEYPELITSTTPQPGATPSPAPPASGTAEKIGRKQLENMTNEEIVKAHKEGRIDIKKE